MNAHWNSGGKPRLTRREMLQFSSIGFGNLALLTLLAEGAQADGGTTIKSPGHAVPNHWRRSRPCSCRTRNA